MIDSSLLPATTTSRDAALVPRLRSPIVLVHGLFGFDGIRIGPWCIAEYFCGIGSHLAKHGNRVLTPCLSPTAGIATRARQLLTFLQTHSPTEPVHVLAHSLGGLDVRYLISRLGGAGRILSLTTIGTPHHGSSYASWWLQRLQAICRPAFDLLRIPYQAFLDLTPDACRLFNKATPDGGRVRYFSVAGHCFGPWMTLAWRHPHAIVAQQEGDNDGVVSIHSATWGEDVRIWDGDHFNLINCKNRAARRLGLWVDRTELYGDLVRRLADEGF